jgi:putative hydrolases of HD superfamily
MFAPPSLSSKINIPHCSKMALVHDMAEALVGDITPVDGVDKHEKNRRESTTMDYFTSSLLGKVNGGLTGQELKAIWQEYEDSETLESKFVHDVDKLELVLQMVEYERVYEHKLDLGEFVGCSSDRA